MAKRSLNSSIGDAASHQKKVCFYRLRIYYEPVTNLGVGVEKSREILYFSQPRFVFSYFPELVDFNPKQNRSFLSIF
jgi:hypothetical protein